MSEIEFSEWQKLDIRVGEIKKVEPHPNADKLSILKVDAGGEEKTLVAGIKENYKEDELIGKKVVVFMNLKPAVLRGVKSEGMVLAAVKDKKVSLLQPDQEIENGSKIE